jgi:hypothetical protein
MDEAGRLVWEDGDSIAHRGRLAPHHFTPVIQTLVEAYRIEELTIEWRKSN